MKPRSFSAADVRAIVDRLGDQIGPARPTTITIREGHSNRVAEVDFDRGRTLVIKQARYEEMAARFETSRVAARLLRQRADVLAPEYLDLTGPDACTTLVYWRIPLPTLEVLWSGLHGDALWHTLHTWGSLIRRIQQVRLPGHGPLLEARARARPLVDFLLHDLQQRLRPAAIGVWPAALRTIDDLLAETPKMMRPRVGDDGAVFIHNDLFAPNILCERASAGEVVCVGVIDFEDSFAGPPEAELAKLEVLHGPLFGQPRSKDFVRAIVAGYGAPLDPGVTTYFRVFHLLNMGYHAAATGLDAHAADVLEACRRELEGIR